MSKPLAIWIVGLALVLLPPCLRADDTKPATGRGIGVDQFVFGGSVRIDRPVPGDLIALGGSGVHCDGPPWRAVDLEGDLFQEQYEALAAEINTELKKRMTTEDVATVREKFLETQKRITGK